MLLATGAPWDLPLPDEPEPLRQYLYVQIWVSQLARQYTIGGTSEIVIRSIAEHELFRGAAGRNYWEITGRRQLSATQGRQRKFFEIIDEEYRKAVSRWAVATPPRPVVLAENNHVPDSAGAGLTGQVLTTVAALGAGIAAGWIWRSNMKAGERLNWQALRPPS